MELARAFATVKTLRILIEQINGPFLFDLKSAPARYMPTPRAALPSAGWWRMRVGRRQVNEAGTALFAEEHRSSRRERPAERYRMR
jgi:hypothetical protein